MDNFSVPSGSLPPIPPSMGNNNAVVAPPVIQPTSPLVAPPPMPTQTPTPTAKILLAVIPFFAFVVTGAISYRLMNQPRPVKYLSRASAPTSAPITLLNQQIAKKTIDWLDKQKDEKGLYFLSRSYPNENSTKQIKGDGRIGIYPLWAKFLFWQKTKDKEVGESMKANLNLFDNNEQRYFQPEFWSCKILYDLFLDTNLSSETKLKTKTLCERAQYYVEIIKKDGYLWSDTIITPVPENPQNLDNSKVDLSKFSAYASDFSTRYLWDKNTNNLTIAKTLFNLSAASYESQKSKGFVPGGCVLGIAAIDLYKSTKEEKYKKFSADLFDKISQQKPIALFDKITCGEWSQHLYNLSHETKYQKRKEKIMQDLINNHYDRAVGAFYTPYGNNRFFEIRENSLMVDLLMN